MLFSCSKGESYEMFFCKFLQLNWNQSYCLRVDGFQHFELASFLLLQVELTLKMLNCNYI
jgi:hypothetical protein